MQTALTKPTAASEALALSKRALSRQRTTLEQQTQQSSVPVPPGPAEASVSESDAEAPPVAAAKGFPARYKVVLGCMMAFVICNMVRPLGVVLYCVLISYHPYGRLSSPPAARSGCLAAPQRPGAAVFNVRPRSVVSNAGTACCRTR